MSYALESRCPLFFFIAHFIPSVHLIWEQAGHIPTIGYKKITAGIEFHMHQ